MNSRLNTGPLNDLTGNSNPSQPLFNRKNNSYRETVIIGAGPAGCEMAYRLASDGFDVLVVEKDHLDREKPCGGGIQIQELVEFGPLQSCRLTQPGRKRTVSGWKFNN
jgi:heterodisulfide reductase subunit A-like polyferredoxin